MITKKEVLQIVENVWLCYFTDLLKGESTIQRKTMLGHTITSGHLIKLGLIDFDGLKQAVVEYFEGGSLEEEWNKRYSEENIRDYTKENLQKAVSASEYFKDNYYDFDRIFQSVRKACIFEEDDDKKERRRDNTPFDQQLRVDLAKIWNFNELVGDISDYVKSFKNRKTTLDKFKNLKNKFKTDLSTPEYYMLRKRALVLEKSPEDESYGTENWSGKEGIFTSGFPTYEDLGKNDYLGGGNLYLELDHDWAYPSYSDPNSIEKDIEIVGTHWFGYANSGQTLECANDTEIFQNWLNGISESSRQDKPYYRNIMIEDNVHWTFSEITKDEEDCLNEKTLLHSSMGITSIGLRDLIYFCAENGFDLGESWAELIRVKSRFSRKGQDYLRINTYI